MGISAVLKLVIGDKEGRIVQISGSTKGDFAPILAEIETIVAVDHE